MLVCKTFKKDLAIRFIILADKNSYEEDRDHHHTILRSNAPTRRVESSVTDKGPKINQKIINAKGTFIKYDR